MTPNRPASSASKSLAPRWRSRLRSSGWATTEAPATGRPSPSTTRPEIFPGGRSTIRRRGGDRRSSPTALPGHRRPARRAAPSSAPSRGLGDRGAVRWRRRARRGEGEEEACSPPRCLREISPRRAARRRTARADRPRSRRRTCSRTTQPTEFRSAGAKTGPPEGSLRRPRPPRPRRRPPDGFDVRSDPSGCGP